MSFDSGAVLGTAEGWSYGGVFSGEGNLSPISLFRVLLVAPAELWIGSQSAACAAFEPFGTGRRCPGGHSRRVMEFLESLSSGLGSITPIWTLTMLSSNPSPNPVRQK